jgi:flagellar hook assembly protein FlgD
VCDQNNMTVKTIINSTAQKKGINSVWWDGKNSAELLCLKDHTHIKLVQLTVWVILI